MGRSRSYGRYYIFEGLADARDELLEWCGTVGIAGFAVTHPAGHLTFAVAEVDVRPKPLVSIDPDVELPELDEDLEQLIGRSLGMGDVRPYREVRVFAAFAKKHDDCHVWQYQYSHRYSVIGIMDITDRKLAEVTENLVMRAVPHRREVGEYPTIIDPVDPDRLLDDWWQDELDECEELDGELEELDPFAFDVEAWNELGRDLLYEFARPILPEDYAMHDQELGPLHDLIRGEYEDHTPEWVELERCRDCAGRGERAEEVTCDVCDGRGTIACEACGEKGHGLLFRCKECGGRGRIECEECLGHRTIEILKICETCDGTGLPYEERAVTEIRE